MKKLFIIFSLVVSLTFILSFTSKAEETTNSEDEFVNAGVMPGSFFYGFDKFFENVAIKLTFSDEKRAERLTKIAEERLAELNELDPDLADQYASELFNEYGLSLEKANIYIAKLINEEKLSEEKITRIENRVEKAYNRQERVREKIREKISAEIKEKVQLRIRNAKASIFSKFIDLDKAIELHDYGFGYGQILKLQALSELSEQSIDDIILIEGAITTNDDNSKTINIDILLDELNLTSEQLKEKLSEYKIQAKAMVKEKINEAQNKAKKRREEIKKAIQEKKNKGK